jgi:hypothetical protein
VPAHDGQDVRAGKGRVALALQETPRYLPSLVVELGLQTHALLRELRNPAGARIMLETERGRAPRTGDGRPPRRPAQLLDEAAWYAMGREARNEDLAPSAGPPTARSQR